MPTKSATRKPRRSKASSTTKLTYVCFVLDESGSMGICRDATIDGFNEQTNAVRQNAKSGGKTSISLFRFGCPPNSHPREFYFDKPVSDLLGISRETYSPYGNTPMYDAIGLALTRLETLPQTDNTGFLVIVVSDGQENASQEWSSARLAEKVKALQNTGKWTFVYIGANQDLTQVRETFGLHAGNMMAYDGSVVGTRRMYCASVQNTAAYFQNVRGMESTMTTAFNVVQPDVVVEEKITTVRVRR